ncbi:MULTISPECIES: hypothetical protein [Bradyrhizobium]|uniref:hypothetical protein n=1 Tax=Bradyrhizobium elkanii TaxID=29448 RepID=UPI00041CD006|nr:hypothetical protein [Bradyrhizobium elkanii]
MTDPKALAAELVRLAERIEQLENHGDVLDQIARGALLTVQRVAVVCEISDQQVLNWIEDSIRRGPRPIGEKLTTWLICTERLFDYIEKFRGGLYARKKAENRLKELWPIWSQPQELNLKTRAAG